MKPALLGIGLVLALCARAQSIDTAARNAADTSVFVMHRSPLAATLLSVALPGAGQIYNGDYLKVPVIWGVGGFLLYEVLWFNRQFVNTQDLYFNSSDSTVRKSPTYFALKEQYRDNRDYYAAFLFLVYVLNIADAYVGAHLFDFPVSNSPFISRVALRPSLAPGGSVGVGLRVGFR